MACKNVQLCFSSISNCGNKYEKCDRSDCLKWCDKRSAVVVNENKKKYELKNNGKEIAVFQVDGEMIKSKEMIKCDSLLYARTGDLVILVELKGADLKHGLEQIKNTLDFIEKKADRARFYGRIVTSNRTNVPNLRTCPQYVELQKKFMRKQGNIKIETNVISDDVAKL